MFKIIKIIIIQLLWSSIKRKRKKNKNFYTQVNNYHNIHELINNAFYSK